MTIVYGYAKAVKYSKDKSSSVQVRIPSIHGPYKQSDAKGKTIQNYVKDEDLPWYPSLLLDHSPTDGEVVALIEDNGFLVIGFTGASYGSETQ
jgi:hypothetical protein